MFRGRGACGGVGRGCVDVMTPLQARAVRRAYDTLYGYVCSDVAAPVPSYAELEELTYGNLLDAETLAVILAKLRGKSFDQILDDLPERDEGCPPGPAAGYMWETSVYQLRLLHAHSWRYRRERLQVFDLPTAFRGSFNLMVSALVEVAAETKTTTRQLVCVLRDAAAVERR